MSSRNAWVALLGLCSAAAVAAGLYLPYAPIAAPRLVPAVSLIAFGAALAFMSIGLRCVGARHQHELHRLRRDLEAVRRRGDLERSHTEILTHITSLIEVFNRTRDLDAVLCHAAAGLKSVLNTDVVVIQLYRDEETRFFTRIEDGAHDVDLGPIIQRDVIGRGHSRLVNRLEDVASDAGLLEQGYRSVIVAPLTRVRAGGLRSPVGLVAALSRSPRDFVSQELHLLTTFANQAGLIIEDAHLFKKTEHLALHDGLLTEIFNRRYFIATLDEEIRSAAESRGRLALIMADIDDFKQHNDTYGHPSGDAALRAVANTFLDNTRGLDVVARYGGEEFVAMLPNTDEQGALTVAETIRRRVEERPLVAPDGRLAHLSISTGVAVYPQHADGPNTLIAAADRALYQAKAEGKNTVVLAAR